MISRSPQNADSHCSHESRSDEPSICLVLWRKAVRPLPKTSVVKCVTGVQFIGPRFDVCSNVRRNHGHQNISQVLALALPRSSVCVWEESRGLAQTKTAQSHRAELRNHPRRHQYSAGMVDKEPSPMQRVGLMFAMSALPTPSARPRLSAASRPCVKQPRRKRRLR